MILALDMASRTGWALVQDGKVIESGIVDFSKRRGESNGLMFLRFRKWLQEITRMSQVRLIAYELAHFRGGAATEICVGLQTRAQEMAAELGIESAPVASSTLKKFATGTGRAGKDEMIEKAAKVIGRRPIDDNEADAVLVGLWAESEYAV